MCSVSYNMDVNEFREFARSAVDFVADYLENIRDRWDIIVAIFNDL